MTPPTRTRSQQVERRALFYLWLYERIGPDRSLARLADLVGEASVQAAMPGLRVTTRTLERYSREFHWQEAVEAFDEETAARHHDIAIQDAIARDVEDAKLARLLKDAGRFAVEKRMAKDSEPLGDAAAIRAIVDGVKLGRLISGEATEIHQFYLAVYDQIGRAISDAHIEAREAVIGRLGPLLREGAEGAVEAARNESADIWGTRLTAVVIEHFRAIGMQEVEVA